MALAVEASNLHRRIALLALNLFGSSPRKLLIGFITPTAFLSMFISNTATAAMMVPIVEAVLEEIQDTKDQSSGTKRGDNLRAMLCMSVAMSANVGGTGTVIGTGPNLVAVQLITQKFGSDTSLTFTSWLGYAVPQMLILLMCIWMWLQFYYLPNPLRKTSELEKLQEKEEEARIKEMLANKQHELGKMDYYESSVLGLFAALVLLWMTRSPGFTKGWGDVLEDRIGVGVSDSTSAMLVCILLFALPASGSFWSLGTNDDAKKILEWKTVQTKLQWGIILLFGGGFALGGASTKSGLSSWIGSQLVGLSDLPIWSIVVITTLGASCLTQVAANVASANIFLPIMIQLAETLCVNPILLVIPPTMACSFSFVLPVSTAPNAIAIEVAGISTFEMVKVGILMNISSLLVTFLCIFSYGYPMFDLGTFPTWAQTASNNCTSVF